MSIVQGRRLTLATWLTALTLALGGPGCKKASPARRTDAPAKAAAPASGLGRPRPAGFKRYDEPKEALEFYAHKRAPVGERAIPSERYRAARERIGEMPVYSTRTGNFAGTAGRGRGEVGAAATGGPDIGTWNALGPGNIGGRTRAIVINPLSPSTMYAGGVAGGVWRTTTSGSAWAPVGDAMANLAVNSLAMKPLDGATLLAGTGEGFFNGDAVRGAGIFRTTDSGANWTQIDSPGTGLNKTCEFHYINDIVYSTLNTSRAYAAVGFSSGCDGATTGGVYRTINNGESWTRIKSVTVSGGCLDLAIRADAGNDVVFASCGTFEPVQSTLILKAGSAQTATTASGWTDLTSDDPLLQSWTPVLGRVSLAIAPSDPDVIYAIGEHFDRHDFLVLARSTTGGDAGTWQQRSAWNDVNAVGRLLFTNTPFGAGCFGSPSSINQGWYDNVMAVDPTNSDVIWVGGIDLFRSDDGGQSFGLASFWWADPTDPGGVSTYAHADQHFLAFSGGKLFVGNDGGIFRADNPGGPVITNVANVCNSANSGIDFTNLNNGYGVTQFYYGAVFPDDTRYLGGAQDNGTISGMDGGPNTWNEIQGGDGGAVAVDPIDTSVLYAETTRLSIQKCTRGPLACRPNTSDWVDAVTGISDPGFLFIAPFIMDPSAPVDDEARKRLWTGGSYIWRTKNSAANWQKASAKVVGSVSAIAVAPSNPNFVLAGTIDPSGGNAGGTIYRTSAGLSVGASTWASRKPRSGYVSSLAFDPWNANVAYATYSTFGGVHVWKSTDGGANWSPLDGTGLPQDRIPDIPAHSIVADPTNSSRLYVGTDLGVFVTIDGGLNWAAENTGFGQVVTEHLVINGANLYAFTHGRGVWRVPLTNATQTALIELVSASSSVTEGDPPTDVVHPVQVRIRTSDHAALGSTATVQWATADGTAKAGSDYLATSGTLTFLAGSTSDGDIQTIPITIVSDLVGEPTQAFGLSLSTPTGAILARRAHTVTIYDTPSDPPGLSINDITVTEGNVGTTSATFTLTLSGPAKVGTTVTYQTVDGSALAGTDYQAVGPVPVAIPAGAMSKTLSVPVINDTVAQPSRAFFVNLTGALLATIDDGQGQATILDNDFSGAIELAGATYSVNENAPSTTIALKRTGGVASGVSVQVETQDGTASSAANADFTAMSTVVNFGAGATTASFTVPITTDTIDEPAETVLLRVFNPGGFGATLGARQTAILTINDDDVPGQIRFAAAAYTVAEGGGIDLKVSRGGGAAGGVTVGYTIAGTAAGGDYTLSPASLTFAAGEMLKTIHLDAVADGLPEGNETVVVTLNPPGGGATLGTPSSTVLTITDLEPTFAFTASQITVVETAKTVVATVRRTGLLTSPATVNYTTNNGTATGGTSTGDDFLPTGGGTLSFAANVPTKTITVTLRPDSDFEPTEDFTIDLSGPTVGVLGSPSSLTVNIPNDDFGGAFSFAVATTTVLESKPSVTLTVKRTGGLANADVTYQTADGTATSGSDFTGAAPTPLHFSAGKTTATIMIPILPDTIGEGNETFTVTLTSPTAGGALGAPSTATVTIQDDDRVVSFGAATYATKESPSLFTKLVIPVKRTGPAGPFTVNYAVVGGTATNGDDYGLFPVPGILSFAATDTVKNITLSIGPDVAPPYEGAETVILALSGPSGAGLGAFPSTTVTIADDAPVIQLAVTTSTATEPAGTTPGQALITVKRTGNLQGGSNVAFTISPGSATAGSDYTTPSSPIGFLGGQSQVQIKVPILPDTEDEPAETFTVTLSSPAGASLGSLVTTTVTINDNDNAGKIQIVGSQYTVTEGAGAAVIQLTRTLGAAGNASVVCRKADGSATAGSDYAATPQTVTFGAGQTSATCTIPITDDATPGEGAETVQVSIDTPSYGVTIGTPSSAILYILDNE